MMPTAAGTFFQPWFYVDVPGGGEGAAIVICYSYVDTKNPMFNFSVQLTPGSKIIIN